MHIHLKFHQVPHGSAVAGFGQRSEPLKNIDITIYSKKVVSWFSFTPLTIAISTSINHGIQPLKNLN
jgi:hypothetical protein